MEQLGNGSWILMIKQKPDFCLPMSIFYWFRRISKKQQKTINIGRVKNCEAKFAQDENLSEMQGITTLNQSF